MVNDLIFSILVCPNCKGPIELVGSGLLCRACKSKYEIIKNIPVMITKKKISLIKDIKPEKDFSSTIKYHLKELEIALNPKNPHHIIPQFKYKYKIILDIGCGIGQTLVASGIYLETDKVIIGLDIDINSLNYGKEYYNNINFINGCGEKLPFKSQSIDFVFSRVSLHLTNIPEAIKEIHRVLKPGGEMWVTLHPFSLTVKTLIKSIINLEYKDMIFRTYVIINGLINHLFGILFPFPINGKFESFQTEKTMLRLLRKNNFKNIIIKRGNHFMITASKDV